MPGANTLPTALVLADAHLDQETRSLDCFLAFLASLQGSACQTIYLLGDLFTIWFGTPKMQRPYQRAVVNALQSLQDQGMQINYVEGNRDYFLAPFYLGVPFRAIASEYMPARIGNKRVYFAHGDLVNVHDTQYRLWRRISRNRAIYACFRWLPGTVALRVADSLEQTLRETNQKQRAVFPTQTCAAYARQILQTGYDLVILGHFHEARQEAFALNGTTKYLYVLPAWKDTHTYLQINACGECAFQQFG